MLPNNKKQSKSKPAKCTTITSSSPLPSTDTPLSGIDYAASFATFICQADLSNIKHFCEAAGSTQETVNFRVFWGCAFAEGKKVGQEEEYNQGYNAGYNEGYSDACKKDYEAGLGANTSASTTEIGTQVDLLPSPMPCIDVSVQTTIKAPSSPVHDNVSTQTSIISHIDTSVQASEPSGPSLSPSQPQKTSVAPLDWAEDANTLPIIPLSSSPRQPRDLSVLRSSSSSPFSSLQHRSKHFSHYSCQPHHHSHSHYNFNSFYTLHHISFKPHSHTKTYSHLIWESDPWLSDLSRSLKALGWILASWYHFFLSSFQFSQFCFAFCVYIFRFLNLHLFALFFHWLVLCSVNEDIIKERGVDGTVGCDLWVTCPAS